MGIFSVSLSLVMILSFSCLCQPCSSPGSLSHNFQIENNRKSSENEYGWLTFPKVKNVCTIRNTFAKYQSCLLLRFLQPLDAQESHSLPLPRGAQYGLLPDLGHLSTSVTIALPLPFLSCLPFPDSAPSKSSSNESSDCLVQSDQHGTQKNSAHLPSTRLTSLGTPQQLVWVMPLF